MKRERKTDTYSSGKGEEGDSAVDFGKKQQLQQLPNNLKKPKPQSKGISLGEKTFVAFCTISFVLIRWQSLTNTRNDGTSMMYAILDKRVGRRVMLIREKQIHPSLEKLSTPV